MTAPRTAAWGALAAALLLAGCASVSPDGLRSQVQTLADGRSAGVAAPALPSADPAARARADAAIVQWLAGPLAADDAVRIALLRNPGLQARLAALGVADAQRVQALTLPNPTLTLGRFRSGHEREIERTLGLGLIDLVTLPWRTRWQGQQMEQATLDAAQDVVRLAFDTRRAWLRAVAAEQVAATQERMHEAADAGAELARRMARVGNWSRLQQAREQALWADSAAQLARARLDAATEREQLSRLMGLWGPAAHYTLPDRLPNLPVEPEASEGIEARALRERLDVRAARLELDRVADTEGFAGVAPWAGGIGLAYTRNTTTEQDTGHADVKRGWEVELAVPLFDWGGAARSQARGRTLQSAAQLQDVALRARSEARTAWLGYRTAYDLARQQRDAVVPLRRFISEETTLRYNGMLASVWQMLAEARASSQAVANALQAQRDFWLAEADLQRALAGTSGGASSAVASTALPGAAAGRAANPESQGH
ncbi:TolC family protein [Acidovorax sp. SUPP2522]|uniref:TolC family protein n=1 Tax=unclassified Acidovorax TaxID=2684926 RepID=UPI002349A4E7|nr:MULTISPECIES: TolC family protein [unclassified Acidovorax]WCM99406.1 TolC family protein [Acidovorax sp. GBBC 1281]GKT16251.1 TolC family protein [Acidovorax sp. SUPP2522]